MIRYLRTWALVFALSAGVVGCTSDDDDDAHIVRPDIPLGDGRAYPLENVVFNTVDGVPVSAVFGKISGQSRLPAVILVHDIGSLNASAEWLLFFENLLENQLQPLAIDLRGHGGTPLPARPSPVLFLDDLDVMHLEVQAALTWLRTQSTVDIGRVGVVGNGAGGNLAYVSMGVFPSELQVGVALSPGMWDFSQPSLEPLLTGAGLDPFAPHTMLYLVGEDDFLPLADNQVLSYLEVANDLAAETIDPKNLEIFPGEQAHGLSLLQSEQAVEIILFWLETHL